MFSLRILIGIVFLISGGEKLFSPRENFLYVIQNYDVLKFPFFENLVSFVFPWVELFVGGFLVLGLWTRLALWLAGGCALTFMGIVSQALIRRLPIQECGCFGELLKVPLPVTLTIDTVIFSTVILLLRRFPQVLRYSLDKYFEPG